MDSAPTAAPLQLAEVQWTWRRWFTYVLTAVLAALVAYLISRLDDPGALKAVGLALCGLIGLGQLLYMAGAVVTDLARLAAAVRAGKSPEVGA